MTVYKRGKKGMFYMDYVHKGVRVYKSTGKYTKRDAKLAEAADKQRMMNEAILSPQEKGAGLLLSVAIEQVFEGKWKNNKDAMGTYRRASRLVELIGDVPIGTINEEMVDDLIRILGATGIEGATINRYLANLKTILKYKKQPYDYIKLKKERNGRIRVLSYEEEQTIIKLLRDTEHSTGRQYFPEVADLIEVLLDTGCRLSEMLNITYADINFTSGLISIWINKGEKPRSLPMTTRVRRILEARQVNNPVKPFTITINQAEYAWGWVRVEMNMQKEAEFVIHHLRHTCASRLVDKGVDLYVVKRILGPLQHSDN